jgi:hypothetical protein
MMQGECGDKVREGQCAIAAPFLPVATCGDFPVVLAAGEKSFADISVRKRFVEKPSARRLLGRYNSPRRTAHEE